ncbi:MAG: Nif3-like dinuclear metal center hexameric protein [Lachnospiraceae bacterium]|nr:Nif3-like dinuclear metal center hexameric protein [Candidatus Equihabitans merdae]
MKSRELTERIEQTYPRSLAESWDNVGLLLGDHSKEINKVLLSLDLSDEAAAKAVEIGADIVITHHPLIFSPMKRITTDDIIGRRLLKLAAHEINYYAMHTNFDIAGMGHLNADDLELQNREVLAVTEENGDTVGFGCIGTLAKEMTVEDLAKKAKAIYNLEAIRVYGDPSKVISKVGICSGSGKSFIREALEHQVDVYITGDLDYHTAIDAVSMGLTLIDGGHYGTEYGFMSYMKDELEAWYPDLEIETMPVKSPYHIV